MMWDRSSACSYILMDSRTASDNLHDHRMRMGTKIANLTIFCSQVHLDNVCRYCLCKGDDHYRASVV